MGVSLSTNRWYLGPNFPLWLLTFSPKCFWFGFAWPSGRGRQPSCTGAASHPWLCWWQGSETSAVQGTQFMFRCTSCLTSVCLTANLNISRSAAPTAKQKKERSAWTNTAQAIPPPTPSPLPPSVPPPKK